MLLFLDNPAKAGQEIIKNQAKYKLATIYGQRYRSLIAKSARKIDAIWLKQYKVKKMLKQYIWRRNSVIAI